MRKLDWRLSGAAIAVMVVGGFWIGVALSGSNQTAVPIASGVLNSSRSSLITTNGGRRTTYVHAQSPKRVASKPQQLFLTRAHSAVFNVRKLKSVVIKKERPEHEAPGGDGDVTAGALPGYKPALPATLSPKQMVKSSTNGPTPSSDASFDGLDFANWGAGHPPDENGDVGPNQYIQTVNTSIGIYDKSTGTRVAAFTFNTFMSQGHFGNLCDTQNFGDPVVLYDSYENRWMITDFAFTLDASGNVSPQTVYQCFAVSKTGDPVNGGWNYYSILDPGGLGDYPKFGIWPDGIYMSTNMFGYASGAGYTGYHVWALNKQQMYVNAPTVSVVDFAGNTSDFTVIPTNSKIATGTPPTGAPEYFVSTELYANALALYKFQVNWDKVSTSTFTGPFAELEPNCWPGDASLANASTPANAADTLAFRTMLAPEYTNIGGVESVWAAHTVGRAVSATNTTCNATTGTNASIRWYQANVTGGTIAGNLTQGSTFDPEGANTFFRFQPALAVDRLGDMGVTYTKSNSTTNPKVMYDGRLAGDATNTLGTENTLMSGTGAQSGTCGPSTCVRWGDYAGMELDPDGCHFWMTGEYFATNGLNDLTRIGSFHFPGCTPVGNGTLSGTVTDGTNPISGATITLGSRTTTTAADGTYSFSVPAGTYASELADQPGYTEGSATSLAVPDGGTKTQNFTLSAAATSGCYTDNSQSTFQRGVPTNCDLTTSPGSVVLSKPTVIDQQNATVTNSGFGVNSTSWAGQTFTQAATAQVTSVDLDLFCSGCTGTTPNITVSIRATTGATPVPTGADLATATIAGFNSASGGFFTATFASPPTLTAGTRYAIVFRAVSNPSAGSYAYVCSCNGGAGTVDSNPYASGQRVTSGNSGATWAADTTVGGRDLGFHVYANHGFVPSATFVSSLKDANPAAGSVPHWTTLSFTATTPASTGVKFQVAPSNSQYGPWNYVGPDGTASTYFTVSGASLSQFNGFRYLRYQALLSSSNTSLTPSLSSVQLCFQDVAAAAATTLTPAAASGTYGGTTTLSATLTSGGNGVPNETVSFSLNGSSVGGATTDANGVATLNSVSLAGINAGSYPSGVGASFAGDSSFLLSSGTNSLTVAKADQAISISTHAPATAAVDDQFTVAATGGGSGNAIAYGSSGGCTNTGATYTITGTGTCTVTYDQAGNSNYNAAPQLTDTVNSSKANQTIHVSTHAPSSAAFGSGFTVAATGGNSGNPVTYGSSGGCTNSGASFTMTSASTDCTVTYDQAGNSNYNAATQVIETVTALKADQTIDVTMHAPSTAAYNSSFDVAANSAGGTVSFSSSGACSNLGSHFTMTSGTGTCTVQFDQSGNGNYNAAPQVTESVTASKIDQSITFANPGTQQFGEDDFDPGATASSGYAVSYSASGNCSIVGGLVHLTGAGSCTVRADQAGDANFNAAPQVPQTFTVTKADQAIVIGTDAPSSATYGSHFTVAATGGGSGNAVTYGSSGSCTNSGADFTMTSGTGTCTVTFDQAGNSNYNAAPQVIETVSAVKADQSILITQHAPSNAAVGDQFTVSATGGGSGNAIVYASSGSCTNSGATFTITSPGTCTVTYDQAGDSNYNAAPQLTESVNSSKADQTIHVSTHAPSSAAYGTGFTVAATGGSSGNAVTYGSLGSCTNSGAHFTMTSGTGTCTVTYNEAGDSNYNAATQVSEAVTAQKAALSITANDRTKYVGQTLALGTTAFSSSGLVGSDSVSGVTLASAGAAAAAASGNYAIAASNAAAGPGTSLGNYTVTYHSGTLHVVEVGIIGLSGVDVSGGHIDSADSSAAFVMSNGEISFAGLSVVGNAISTLGAVSVANGTSVSGFVTAGTTVFNHGTIGGTVTQNSPSGALSATPVAACSKFSKRTGISGGVFTYSRGSGDLVVKSGIVKLKKGTYCFHNVQINGGAVLSVGGPVTIHLTGTLVSKGSGGRIVNRSGKPSMLHVDSSFTGSNGVMLVGDPRTAMILLAPKTDVTISKNSFRGTVIAASVTLSNVGFHTDQH